MERQQIRQEIAQGNDQVREVRLEHLRWRRERRQHAYLELLEALSAADRANQHYFRGLQGATGPTQVDEARLAEIRQLFKNAEQVFYKVVLEGPPDVAEAAQRLIDHCGSLIGEVREFAGAQAEMVVDLVDRSDAVEMAGRSFMATQREFLSTASSALDEIADVS
ncbi:hypothetical protein [Nocardia sp. SYP-A9097]|uniref:hypothetical protein n=1 Tax=Nocardia sp. SYP-A9097 TaxID=2663237 RepID=UPI001E506895|nr:hypothetical protein [Nocardia sp. SYP-A9097]